MNEPTIRSDEEMLQLIKVAHEKHIKQALISLSQDLKEISVIESEPVTSLIFYLPNGKLTVSLDTRI